jgi:hypothetical protein
VTSPITERPPQGLPPLEVLTAVIRKHLSAGSEREAVDAALDEAAPGLDRLTGVAGAAEWFGIAPKTIYQDSSRKRADGSPRWPAPDQVVGRSRLWTWRTLAWHAASSPGGGGGKQAWQPGRPRPKRSAGE